MTPSHTTRLTLVAVLVATTAFACHKTFKHGDRGFSTESHSDAADASAVSNGRETDAADPPGPPSGASDASGGAGDASHPPPVAAQPEAGKLDAGKSPLDSGTDASVGADGAAGEPSTLWPESFIPSPSPRVGTRAVELGVRFRAEVSGSVIGLRFFKQATDDGPHSGSLWTTDGELLAQVKFVSETDEGWQQANFAQAIAIDANVPHVVSYHSTGRFAAEELFFSSGGLARGPLYAYGSNDDQGPNGVYSYSINSTFPDRTYRDSNYWVTPVFMATTQE